MMPTRARAPPAPGARAGYERGVWFWSDIVTGAARRGHNATSAEAAKRAAAGAAAAAAAAAGLDVAASWVDRFSLGRAGSTSRGAHWAAIRAAVPLAPRLSPGVGRALDRAWQEACAARGGTAWEARRRADVCTAHEAAKLTLRPEEQG